MTGNVCMYDSVRGFGFVASPDGPNVFFHVSDVAGGDSESIQIGALMRFEVVDTPKGPRAVRVEVVETEPATADSFR